MEYQVSRNNPCLRLIESRGPIERNTEITATPYESFDANGTKQKQTKPAIAESENVFELF